MLEVQNLTKRYGERVALNGLSLAIPSGQFVALLGPNGAGKSTLFQVLTGLFVADEGEVSVAFQQMSLDLDLSVRRNLQFHADLHGLPRATAKQRIAEGCEALGTTADLDRTVRELSGGNRRKVELVRALLHRPAVLLMDEPTVGLDPKSRRDLMATARCCGPPTWWKKPKPPTACWCCTRASCWPMARRPPWRNNWAARGSKKLSSAPPPEPDSNKETA